MMGHSIPVVGITTVPNFYSCNENFDCDFVVADSGHTMLRLTALKFPHIQFSLLASPDSDFTLEDLIPKCS